MFGFQFGQRQAQRLGLVRADAFHEVHQRGAPASGVGGLVERIDHQTRDQLVAAVRGGVAVRAVVTVLDDQVLLREPLQNGHDGGVRQVAVRGQGFVDLPHGLGLRRGPQVVHYRLLQLT